jgi:hypothetical protein
MKRIGFLLALALVLVSLTTPVFADDPDGDVVIWGDDYTLPSGERIRGDLLVYGGDVDLERGSQVEGDVTVFGGKLSISGNVNGDVTVWGGNVQVRSGATVRGKVAAIGGNLIREEGADIRGDEIEGFPFRPPMPPKAPKPPVPPQVPQVRTIRPWNSDLFRRVSSFFRSVFGVLLMVVLGILVVVFIPRHTQTVAETMVSAPVQSFVSGLAALVAGAIGAIVLSIISALLIATICLAPVGFLLFLPILVAGVALLFGWIAAGLLVGVKVLRAVTHKEPNQVAAVAVGILGLSLLSAIPCLGWALALVALTWSLGAVVYSLFGTRIPTSTSSAGNVPPADDGTPEDYDARMDRL